MALKRGRGPEFLTRLLRERREEALRAAGHVLEAETVKLLTQPGTGRLYTRRGRRRQASAPGGPPAIDTGRLRTSIKTQILGAGATARMRVGTDVKYARFLEFGTRRMRPRPFMRPALAMASRKMTDAIVRVLRGEL